MTADPHISDRDTTPDDSPETQTDQTQAAQSDSPEASEHKPHATTNGSTETTTISAGPHRSPGGKGVAWLALLLALACAGWLAWQWWQDDRIDQSASMDAPQVRSLIDSEVQTYQSSQASIQSQQEQAIAAVREELDRIQSQMIQLSQRDNSALVTTVNDLDRRVDSQQQSADQQLNRLSERLQRLATAYAGISQQRTGGDHLDLTLAEVASQLNMANNYLLIHADSSVARSLISQTQRQLDSHDEPLLSGLRQELARVAQSLDRVVEPNLAVLTGVISGLSSESSNWPMLSERRASNDEHNEVRPDEDDNSNWSRFKQTLSGLVVIRRDQTGDTALLSLREEELLRENLRLQLQVAQLAAVRRDQALFNQSLDQVSGWMSRYYDVEAAPLQAARARLDELRGTTLRPELPDLTAALAELNRARGAVQALDQVPASVPVSVPETES